MSGHHSADIHSVSQAPPDSWQCRRMDRSRHRIIGSPSRHEQPAVRRHRRLRRRRPRIHRRARHRASSRPPTVEWCGTTTSYAFLSGDAPTIGAPQPVAAEPAVRQAGPLRGGRGHLPGARSRPVEHQLHRRRHRRHRHRSADLHRDRGRRAAVYTARTAGTGRSSPSSTPTATSITSAACSA